MYCCFCSCCTVPSSAAPGFEGGNGCSRVSATTVLWRIYRRPALCCASLGLGNGDPSSTRSFLRSLDRSVERRSEAFILTPPTHCSPLITTTIRPCHAHILQSQSSEEWANLERSIKYPDLPKRCLSGPPDISAGPFRPATSCSCASPSVRTVQSTSPCGPWSLSARVRAETSITQHQASRPGESRIA